MRGAKDILFCFKTLDKKEKVGYNGAKTQCAAERVFSAALLLSCRFIFILER